MIHEKYFLWLVSNEGKRLLSNFISLSILQGINYLLPLITLPYLVRVLEVENFGLLSFATATVAYFGLIIEYGFDLTATREISMYRDDKKKIEEIFNAVMIIKFVLMCIALLLLLLLVYSFEKFHQDALIYLLCFCVVVGQMLFPVWFFQGIEQMKYITYITIGPKLIFTMAIFVFVQEKNDFHMVPILSAAGSIIGGLYSLFFIRKKFGIKFNIQKVSTLKSFLYEAHNIFVSKLAISLYTVSTIFILGIFTNNTIVGYFAAADKIIQAFKSLINPISQTIYPYLSKKASISQSEGLFFLRRATFYIAIFTGLISACVFLFSDFLVQVLLGKEYESAVILIKIMAFLPLLVGLSNMFGIQTMLNFGRKKPFSQILIVGSLLSLVLSFLLVPIYQDIGSAISVLIVESFITITMFVYLQNNGLKIIGENSRV